MKKADCAVTNMLYTPSTTATSSSCGDGAEAVAHVSLPRGCVSIRVRFYRQELGPFDKLNMSLGSCLHFIITYHYSRVYSLSRREQLHRPSRKVLLLCHKLLSVSTGLANNAVNLGSEHLFPITCPRDTCAKIRHPSFFIYIVLHVHAPRSFTALAEHLPVHLSVDALDNPSTHSLLTLPVTAFHRFLDTRSLAAVLA